MLRTARLRVVALAAAVLTAVVAAAGVPAQASADPPVVRTDHGMLRGVRAGPVDSFLGVPYAAPPTGALRWRPPRPTAPWPGVRAADHRGGRCPTPGTPFPPRSETEDCLYLNVQRPAGAHRGARLPVYLWIHGGGLASGSSDPYDGGQLVRSAGVVVVTINYRLGVFGFLGHPALTAEGAGESGNYGLLDQQAALRWVHRNIAAFGGNPRAVTIGGESAGGWSVCAHLVAPASRGLFSAAIVQSGGCVSRTQAAADTAGTAVATAVGCPDAAAALACLRAVPAARLVDATPGTSLFVRGGRTLPRDPRVAVREGRFAHVPVIIGANRDEARTFTVAQVGWTRERYEASMRDTFGPRADAVLALYPWPATADRFTAAYLSGAVLTDSGLGVDLGGCPGRLLARDLARHTRTYAYRFDHRTGPGITAGPPGYVWGAGHGAELQYLWPSLRDALPADRPLTAAEQRLAGEMTRYWGAFIRHGRPLVPALPSWPRHDGAGTVLSLRAGGHSTVLPDATLAAQHRCGFWDALP
ncbi:MAG TPA: carboxylesterase family protein [Mycobacteriales bacterium]